MKDLIIIGAGVVGKTIHSLSDTVIVVNEQQKQTIRDIEPFVIKSNKYDFDYGIKNKKPKNKEWQKRIKNLQNSLK